MVFLIIEGEVQLSKNNVSLGLIGPGMLVGLEEYISTEGKINVERQHQVVVTTEKC